MTMPILMTGGTVERKVIAQVDHGQWVQDEHGVRAIAGEVVLCTFEGVPFERMQQRTVVVRQVAIALPDLVLLRRQLTSLIDDAIAHGALAIPEEWR